MGGREGGREDSTRSCVLKLHITTLHCGMGSACLNLIFKIISDRADIHIHTHIPIQ